MSNGRPFKVWSHDREVKKGVVVSSLSELKLKGKPLVGFSESEPVKVLLEEDGTEVSDEDYFAFLPHNTTLMLVKPSQKWLPSGAETQKGLDEPDYMCNDGTEISEKTKQLISGLHNNITRIITLSNEDLQVIVDMSTEALAHLLQDTESYAKAVQDACQRHLDERTQTAEAMDLLKLYHSARQHSPYVGESDLKRKKQANT